MTTAISAAARSDATQETTERAPSDGFWKRRDAFIVVFGTFTVSVGSFLLTRAYADRFSELDFATLLVFRVWSSVVIALFTFGMPLALQRTVAYLGTDRARANAAAAAGFAIGVFGFLPIALAATFFADFVATSVQYADAAGIWRSFMALAVVQVIASLLSSIDLARGRACSAIAISFLVTVVAPFFTLAAVCAKDARAETVLYATAVVSFIAASPFILAFVLKLKHTSLSAVFNESPAIFKFGMTRVPANFGDTAIDVSGTWIHSVLHGDLIEASAIVLGLNLLRMLNPISTALNQLLIPSAAHLAATNRRDLLAERIGLAASAAVHCGVCGGALLIVWSDSVLRVWLGDEFSKHTPIVRIVVAAIAPIFVFQSLRGLLDGAESFPHNTLNLIVTFLGVALTSLITEVYALPVVWIAVVYFVARFILALLTLRSARSLCPPLFKRLELGKGLMLNGAIIVANIAIFSYIPTVLRSGIMFLALPLSAIAFIFAIRVLEPNWSRGILFRSRIRS